MNTMEAITLAESKRLIELEKIVARGKQTFIEVGIALTEIRDSRLYRSDHDTFEAYCRTKWNFTRQYVNQIIAGTAAVKSLPADLETIVSNVQQARELAKVAPEHRAEVLTKAVEKSKAKGKPITAEKIKEAAVEVLPPAPLEERPGHDLRMERAFKEYGCISPHLKYSMLRQFLIYPEDLNCPLEDLPDLQRRVRRWLREVVRHVKSKAKGAA